jgi:hypothetical protein
MTLILLSQIGPAPPKLKGVYLPMPLAPSVSDLVKASLHEMRGSAVVVVEDDFITLLPKINAGVRFPGGRLRLVTSGRDIPYGVPAMPWMGGGSGNGPGKVYPMGWGY